MHVYVLCRKRRLPLRAESSSVKKIYYFNLIFSFFSFRYDSIKQGDELRADLAVSSSGSGQRPVGTLGWYSSR